MSKELHLHHFSLDSKGLCGHMVLQRKNYGPQLRVVYFCRMHHKELFSGNEFLFLRSTNQNTAPSLIQIYTHNARPHPQYVSQTSSKRLKAKPFSKDLIRHNSIKSLCIRNFITFSFPFIKQFQLKDDVINLESHQRPLFSISQGVTSPSSLKIFFFHASIAKDLPDLQNILQGSTR